MSHPTFEERLQAAFSPASEPKSLGAKIDIALDRRRGGTRIQRRVAFSLIATAAATVALVTIPAVQAQAAIERIASALDGVARVRMTRTGVDDKGQAFTSGTVEYDHGSWRVENGTGELEAFCLGGRTYNFDSTLKAYLTSNRPLFGRTTSIRLSQLLADSTSFSLAKRVTVDEAILHGKTVLHAVVDNPGLPERTEFFADPETELPIEVHSVSKEPNGWRLREVMTFDYAPQIAPSAFRLDTKNYLVLTEEEAEHRFTRAMTSKIVAEAPMANGRLVVRAIDVARDGTVFVAYQAGGHSLNTTFGRAIDLRDNLGTNYILSEELTAMQGQGSLADSKDGKLEVEYFVPVTPVDPRRPRTLALSTQRFDDGSLARLAPGWIVKPNGEEHETWTPNRRKGGDEKATPVPLLDVHVDRPTCDESPSYLGRLDLTSFGYPVRAQIAKYGRRANHFLGKKQWGEAERWLNETLNAMHRHERLGYGSWNEAPVRRSLDKVRQTVRRP